jgi:predicted house-cleaning noncanonical NTP pyrophosphatase (MazG superfamily)
VRVTYNKLVRDRIPEIIEADGRHPVTRVLDEPAYQAALMDKLAEEVEEVRKSEPEGLADELADVLEVLQAIAESHALPWDDIPALAAKKRTKNGAFKHRLFLEHVEAQDLQQKSH